VIPVFKTGKEMRIRLNQVRVDVFSLKSSSGEFGYSARSLAKDVLAPTGREIGVN
jgi:hypothetical protein